MVEDFVLMRSDIEEPLFYKGMFEDTPDRYDAVVFTFDLAVRRARQLREFGGLYRVVLR